jgi:hypothetical protein
LHVRECRSALRAVECSPSGDDFDIAEHQRARHRPREEFMREAELDGTDSLGSRALLRA